MSLRVLLLLLFALPALAADGDPYLGPTYADSAGAFYLCNPTTPAVGPCALFTMPSRAVAGYTVGRIAFELNNITGCASCQVDIREVSGTTSHLLKQPTDTHTLDCSGTSLFVLPSGAGIAGNVQPNVIAETSCTKLDVVVHLGQQ
jgi:hypothetical protein